MSFTPRTNAPDRSNSYYDWSSGFKGQCTWYANGRTGEITNGYSYAPRYYHGSGRIHSWPAAGGWLSDAASNGFAISTSEWSPGDVVVYSGSGGQHVAVIEWDNGDGTYHLSDYNHNGDLKFYHYDIKIGSSLISTMPVIGYIRMEQSSPSPGPTPAPEPDQPIDPVYGPGGTIWLRSFCMSCHYTIYNDTSGLYWHPGMKLYLNGSVVATADKGYYSESGSTYSDLEWSCGNSLTKTDDIQVRLNGLHENCSNFAIQKAYSYIDYYVFSDTDLGGTRHIRTFNGENWTDWAPSLNNGIWN